MAHFTCSIGGIARTIEGFSLGFERRETTDDRRQTTDDRGIEERVNRWKGGRWKSPSTNLSSEIERVWGFAVVGVVERAERI